MSDKAIQNNFVLSALSCSNAVSSFHNFAPKPMLVPMKRPGMPTASSLSAHENCSMSDPQISGWPDHLKQPAHQKLSPSKSISRFDMQTGVKLVPGQRKK